MNLLLDTHVLLWWLADDAALKADAREAIGDASNMIYVSAASAWEISIKKALGKLDAPDDLHAALVANHFQPLPITIQHGTSVVSQNFGHITGRPPVVIPAKAGI